MSSHDLSWRVERYPDGEGNFSYGCPGLDLMGFVDIDELLIHMLWKIKKLEKGAPAPAGTSSSRSVAK